MRKEIYSFIITIFFCLTLTACGQSHKKKQQQPPAQLPHYNLEQPQVFNLPSVLNEISGIAFRNGNADTVFAEQDEEGKLFRLSLSNSQITETKFGKRGDYEDVQLINNQVVMLRSDGALYSFPLNTNNAEATDVREFKKLIPDGEYESLYADDVTNKLYVLCKDCNEKINKTNTGYILSIDNTGIIKAESNFTIDVEKITELREGKRTNFQPSALAWNQKTSEWFIVSSVNKMLVTTDKNWNVKSVYPLDKTLFNQPEGIAFDAAGNLYISNEKGKSSNATILKINYK